VALKDMDYQTHGGVPLLGVNGITIIGHGSSSPLALKNMILKAKKMHELNLIKKFEEELGKYGKD
jgi:glycerol-3-phosphate acyltransferase PlsX